MVICVEKHFLKQIFTNNTHYDINVYTYIDKYTKIIGKYFLPRVVNNFQECSE